MCYIEDYTYICEIVDSLVYETYGILNYIDLKHSPELEFHNSAMYVDPPCILNNIRIL